MDEIVVNTNEASVKQAMLNSLTEFTTDFMEDRNQPPQQNRESFD